MTASADITSHTPFGEVPHTQSAHGMLANASRHLIGGALVLAAFGLWFAPGGSWEPDVTIMKLGLSLFAAFAGLAVLSGQEVAQKAQVEIDTVRREIRLVTGKGRNSEVVNSMSIRDLGRAEIDGPIVRLWDAQGGQIAEVPMNKTKFGGDLVSILRDEGKL